jgi:Sec-independent protein translocase protein TatA
MFGIGTPELILIVLLIALVLGPRNLPKAARKAGELKREFDRMRGSVASVLDPRAILDPTPEPTASERRAATDADGQETPKRDDQP